MTRHSPTSFLPQSEIEISVQLIGNQPDPTGLRQARAYSADPIAERLRPGPLDLAGARRAYHGDEDLRLAYLAGQPIDDHRRRVAGVIAEQLVTAHMGLAHGDRALAFPQAVELAGAGVAAALRNDDTSGRVALVGLLAQYRHRALRKLSIQRRKPRVQWNGSCAADALPVFPPRGQHATRASALSRETDHSRVPAPPHMTTGAI